MEPPWPISAAAFDPSRFHYSRTSHFSLFLFKLLTLHRKLENEVSRDDWFRCVSLAISFPTQVKFAKHHLMRRPNRTELEFAFLVFLYVVPMGYWMLRTVLAFIGL